MSSPPYITDFAVQEKYTYLNGFGNHHQSEAFADAIPLVNNHPQIPALGLVTEKISGSAMPAYPRNFNLWVYLYRARSSYDHSTFEPYNQHLESANPPRPTRSSPNSLIWRNFHSDKKGNWLEQRLVGSNGNPKEKLGVAMWLFDINKDMPAQTVFSSLDGEALIVPQSGSLDIQTEYGKLLVRQCEIAVIPRGTRYRVDLVDGKPARGYVLELYEGHFRLPELGVIGSTGLASARDFQIPTAYFEGKIKKQGDTRVAVANNGTGKWTIISRLDQKLWSATQATTPFNVAGWQGTMYPYKYDVQRFSYIGNLNFDHADPSIFTVLTAPAFGRGPGTAVIDFAAIGPRWNTVEDTLWVPWFHRNTATEFVVPVIRNQDPKAPLNASGEFGPWGAWMNSNMVTHGSNDDEMAQWRAVDTLKGIKLQDGEIVACSFETGNTLILSDWAFESAAKNFKDQTKVAFDA